MTKFRYQIRYNIGFVSSPVVAWFVACKKKKKKLSIAFLCWLDVLLHKSNSSWVIVLLSGVFIQRYTTGKKIHQYFRNKCLVLSLNSLPLCVHHDYNCVVLGMIKLQRILSISEILRFCFHLLAIARLQRFLDSIL